MKSNYDFHHANIALIDTHINHHRTFLCRLKSFFDVIGISVQKIRKHSAPSNNIKIPTCDEFDYLTRETCFSGPIFPVQSGLNYNVTKEFNSNSQGNYETIFPDRKTQLLDVFVNIDQVFHYVNSHTIT